MPPTKTAKTTAVQSPAPKQPPKKKAPSRPIVYPEIKVTECIGEGALTVDAAKEILGWEEVEAPNDATSPELYTLTGKHVVMKWNMRNRFLTPSNLQALTQEHLYKRWRFNGDTIVIGKSKSLLQGQHRLISLILAEMERTDEQHSAYWADYWPGPVTMETVLVYGVEEDDTTFRTLNTGREATAAEVFYRCDYFADRKPSERKDLARMLEYAVRFCWVRTGWDADAFLPKGKRILTNSESLEWVNRHKRLPDAVKTIYELERGKNGAVEGGVSRYLSLGYSSALLYLMAMGRSDGDAYKLAIAEGYAGEMRNQRTPLLDWGLWDNAVQFWTLLASRESNSTEMKALREARRNFPQLTEMDGYVFHSGSGAPMKEKVAYIATGWRSFVEHGKVRPRDMGETNLPYIRDPETGEWSLNIAPNVGGIDLAWSETSVRINVVSGPMVSDEAPDSDEDPKDDKEGMPSEEDIEAAKEQIHTERSQKVAEKQKEDESKKSAERVRRLKERQEARAKEEEAKKQAEHEKHQAEQEKEKEAERKRQEEAERKRQEEAERTSKVKAATDAAAKVRAVRRAKKPEPEPEPVIEEPSQANVEPTQTIEEPAADLPATEEVAVASGEEHTAST